MKLFGIIEDGVIILHHFKKCMITFLCIVNKKKTTYIQYNGSTVRKKLPEAIETTVRKKDQW